MVEGRLKRGSSELMTETTSRKSLLPIGKLLKSNFPGLLKKTPQNYQLYII